MAFVSRDKASEPAADHRALRRYTAIGWADALLDPTLELDDSNGMAVDSNDDWKTAPNKQDIINTGAQPTDIHE
jgi:hypothetical protein